jgi:hypothetical protein
MEYAIAKEALEQGGEIQANGEIIAQLAELELAFVGGGIGDAQV